MFTDDQELLQSQYDTKSSLMASESEMLTVIDGLNETQKQIFTSSTDIKVEQEYNLDTDDDGINDAMDKNDNGVDDAEEKLYNLDTDGDGVDDAIDLNDNGIDDELELESELVKPGFSKKYVLIGLILGLFIHCGVYFLLLIFVPVIRTGLELSDMLGIKSFGCMHSDPKKFGLYCVKWMYNLLYHKEKSTDELLNDTAERITVYSKYHDISSLSLLSADADSAAMIEKLNSKLSAFGINVKHVNLWDGDKLTDLAEETMSESDNYILCLMPRATLISDVDKMLSVAREYEKKVIGTVAI